MKDFSTAAIIRLIEMGLKRQGIAMPQKVDARGPHVALRDKRELISALPDRYGALCLLRIGEVLGEVPDEPILIAMKLAHDPHDLLERWQRLERYAHSRHRTIVQQSGSGYLALRHISCKDGSPPLPSENLLIAGVLTGFLELIGTHGLTVRVGNDCGQTYSNGKWSGNRLATDAADWVFSWNAGPRQSTRQPLGTQHENWLAAVRARLEADPGRRWSVDFLAASLDMSPRSLQRMLRREGSGFSQILGGVRLARSAELLAETNYSPAEIGYACGYSDQAHFTRSFKRHTALTPIAFRKNFT